MNLRQLADAIYQAERAPGAIAWMVHVASPQHVEPVTVSNVTLTPSVGSPTDFRGVLLAPKQARRLAALVLSARGVRLLNDEQVVALDLRKWQEFLDAFGITVDA